MATTIIEQLAGFTVDARYSRLPGEVIDECKRLLLDSLGCALAATEEPKGRIGVEYGRVLGGSSHEATIIGTDYRSSIFGAAFANGELINTLDFDAVLPPGHVTPYVLPGALAVGEQVRASGRDLIVAVALSHEMSFRFGQAMSGMRDVQDGRVLLPEVLGYSNTIFGATSAIAKLKGFDAGTLSDALGIAASISPVNSFRSWTMHAPSSTIKYLMAGALTQSAITATYMGELGHRGDLRQLDDPQFGYPRFIGTAKWAPENLTDGLGSEWRFPVAVSYKPYPHCRILHALVDAVTDIVASNDIAPDEIESITTWGAGWVEQPLWTNRDIDHVHDAQYSMAHGISVAAHRVPPGRAWQDPEIVFSPSVLGLMDRITNDVHPDYARLLATDPASRPSRVEIVARGETFTQDRGFPKGSRSTDPATWMTTDELCAKFRTNAGEVMSADAIERTVDAILALENAEDIGSIMAGLTPSRTELATSGTPANAAGA